MEDIRDEEVHCDLGERGTCPVVRARAEKEGSGSNRTHAHVLLQADSGPEGPNWTDETISEAFAVHPLTVVLDNLNTHVPASLYATFPPEEAQRLLRRLVHHTPKHGRWLNMAAIEFSVLSRQWLDRRIADKTTLISEVIAWEVARNGNATSVDGRFTTPDARIKLKRLYPVIHN